MNEYSGSIFINKIVLFDGNKQSIISKASDDAILFPASKLYSLGNHNHNHRQPSHIKSSYNILRINSDVM